MDKQLEAKSMQQQFQEDYEGYRQKINMFAEQRGLPARINKFLVTDMEAQGFNHAPHLLNMGVDTVGFFSGRDLTLVHDGIDYYYAYQDHKDNANLTRQRKEISSELISVLELLGPPGNYTQALAQQQLISKINPAFLDSHHYEQFQNIYKQCNAKVGHYAHTANLQRLMRIEKEQEALVANQGQYFSYAREIKNVNESILKKVDAIQNLAVVPEQVAELIQDLEEQGIASSEQFVTLLKQNATVYSEVKKVTDYLAAEQHRKLVAQQQQLQLENYQGLTNACHFVGEVARAVGSKELATTAMLAQGSVQVYRAAQQIVSGGLAGFALLNPLSAIGMVALNVISFFQRQQNPNKVLLQQLQVVSRQIRSLHRDVMENFSLNEEQLGHLLGVVTNSFNNIDKYLGSSVSRRIDEIQKDLSLLLHIVEFGFREVLLDDLTGMVSYVSSIRRGIIPVREGDRNNYEDRLCRLSDYAQQKASSEIFTGEIYGSLLQSSNISRLIEILCHAQDEKKLSYIIGLLLLYGKNYLKIVSLQQIGDRKVVQPNIWCVAIHTYLEFWYLVGSKINFDPKGINLQEFKSQADFLLNFVVILQTDAEIYQKLFDSIISSTRTLQSELDKITSQSAPTAKTPGVDLNSLINRVRNKPPRDPLVIYEIPEKLKNKEKAVKLIDGLCAKDNIIPLLHRHNIIVPAEFLLAEELGLGRLEYRYHTPIELKKKHHRHGGYRLKGGYTAGLEINFICQGQKIPLFAPGKTEKAKDNDLASLYTRYILTLTKPVHNLQSCQYITQIVAQHLAANKKQLSLDLLRVLTQSQAYQELLRSCYFLQAYLVCAGFPKLEQQLTAAVIPKTDYVKALEQYEKFPDMHTFPMPSFTPIEALIALKETILKVLMQARNNEFREQYFSNGIIAQVHGVLLQLNQWQVQQAIGMEPALTSTPTTVYENTRGAFFPRTLALTATTNAPSSIPVAGSNIHS